MATATITATTTSTTSTYVCHELRALRLAAGLSCGAQRVATREYVRTDLYGLLPRDVSASTIQALEHGRPARAATVEKLAAALGVDPAHLIDGQP
jgi:hypothetical protein